MKNILVKLTSFYDNHMFNLLKILGIYFLSNIYFMHLLPKVFIVSHLLFWVLMIITMIAFFKISYLMSKPLTKKELEIYSYIMNFLTFGLFVKMFHYFYLN